MRRRTDQYPDYRKSRVPWLGAVPPHWEVRRLKHAVDINPATLSEATDPKYAFDYMDIDSVGTGYLVNAPVRHRFGNAPSRARRVMRTGDTAISTVRTYLKATYHLQSDWPDLIASTGFAILRPPVTIVPALLGHIVQSHAFITQVMCASVGVAYPAINETKLGALAIALPPLPEQRAIVRYLDYVDRRIRRYVSAKQKLIVLLEEEKQAVINQAATRGLDPNVRLKPSGVEWLGDVPEHWEVSALKWYSRCQSGNGLPPDEVLSEPLGERCIPAIGGNGLMGFTGRSNCNARVLAIGRVGALCGNVHMIEDPAWITDNALVLSVQSDSTSLKYIAGVLRARNLNDIANKTAQPLITGTGVLNERIPLPPMAEQTSIVKYLDKATGDIDAAVARARRQIELIEEYRTRLIADVVTGKLDVREAAAGLPDEPDDANRTEAGGAAEDVAGEFARADAV